MANNPICISCNQYFLSKEEESHYVELFRTLHPQVAEQLEKTLAKFVTQPRVIAGEPYLTAMEKALYAIVLDAEQFLREHPEEEELLGSVFFP